VVVMTRASSFSERAREEIFRDFRLTIISLSLTTLDMLARRLVQTRVPTELQYLSYLSLRSPSRSHHLILPSPSTSSLRSRPNISSSSPAPPTALSYGLQKRYFHPTPKREGLPVIWSLLAVLKVRLTVVLFRFRT
jgi:hypothetical protein